MDVRTPESSDRYIAYASCQSRGDACHDSKLIVPECEGSSRVFFNEIFPDGIHHVPGPNLSHHCASRPHRYINFFLVRPHRACVVGKIKVQKSVLAGEARSTLPIYLILREMNDWRGKNPFLKHPPSFIKWSFHDTRVAMLLEQEKFSRDFFNRDFFGTGATMKETLACVVSR